MVLAFFGIAEVRIYFGFVDLSDSDGDINIVFKLLWPLGSPESPSQISFWIGTKYSSKKIRLNLGME
jgi:hypothetical protein